MKKLIANHKFTQKIFLSIIIVLLLSFAIPVHSQADAGGLLLDPLFDLAGTLLDVVCGALQAFLVDGQFNNSGDLNIANIYLAGIEDFNEKVNLQPGDENYDPSYAEFAYSAGAPVQKEFNSEDLDTNIWGGSTYAIPMLRYTPEKIFAGLIPALDINFINPTDWSATDNNSETTTESPENNRSIAIQLHETIATWYVSLRNLTVVGLMLILVYVGIRMVISSAASDKAKYKQMLMDWLVAMCIVFCLHYIMTFTITIVTEISQAIAGATEQNGNNIGVQVKNASGDVEAEFSTDLMGLIRFQMQYNTVGSKLLYLLFYMAMVIYTCMFTFYYLRRVLIMAFLTLISPLVALTYPIDKMRDGKAQAFDMWLKEYVFNALVQPFHLIIYSIFVGSAVELAANNPLYAIIALAFITPAEKILRKFFGFDKSGTAGALGTIAGIAGGAAVISGFKSLMAPRKGGGGSGNKGVRQKGKVEGAKPSIGEAFGTTNGATIREAEQPSQILSNGGTAEDGADTLPTVGSTAGMSQNSNGLWLPNSTLSSGSSASDQRLGGTPTSSSTPSSNIRTSGQHLAGTSFAYSDNDGRGIGQWLGDGIRNSNLGQGAHSVLTGVKGRARALADNSVGRLPRPIRNSARGAFNVAGKTALAVGKTAAKAAPGAMIGLAAGIAGDELGDMWKYTLAGAAVSSTIGSSAASQAGSFIANAYNEGAHGDIEGQIEQRRRNFENDENNQLLARSMNPKASDEEIKEKMRKASYYDSIGIETKDTFKAVKLEDRLKREMMKEGRTEDDSAKLAQKQAAVIADIAKDYSKKDLKDRDEVMNLRTDLSTKLDKAGLKGNEKAKTVEKLVSEIKSFKGVSNNY